MKIGLIADIHSNLPALTEVLADLAAEQVEAYLVLGDLVGYGPYPNECIEVLQKLPNAVIIVGNHDWAAIELEDISLFNAEARQAILWTRSVLNPGVKEYLGSLEYIISKDRYMLVHGSPRDPLDEYLVNVDIFEKNIPALKADICFIGHSHLPLYFSKQKDGGNPDVRPIKDQEVINLTPGTIHIINPGSVGQPRDRDARASYGIFDTEALAFTQKRKAYDVAAVQAKMTEQLLPKSLIDRLAEGI
ncbi:MAG: metallophosphoesterase family protein [bacterium]|nr:metallophosphoesterase family protein [bacterium]MDD5354590.1 metallophosphoesterase family protein [bacterium]